jgi:DNA-binding NarL/FixJ family response regulator
MASERSPETVLIVDDHMLVRRGIERVVEQLFVPCSCATYDQAIHELDAMSEPPAALILDVNLGCPRGDGLDVGEYAFTRFERHIPTLVISDSHLVPEITERALRLRAEFLAKPHSPSAIHLFLERVLVRARWGASDVIDLDRETQRFAEFHRLTSRQTRLLFVLLRAAERGERAELNENTRKAGLRRILRRTGHGSFEELRLSVKQLAEGTRRMR